MRTRQPVRLRVAKFLCSPIITKAEGAAGPLCFSTWNGLNIVKTKPIPSNPNSAAQQAVRLSYSRLAALWKGSEAFFHGLWNDYASDRDNCGYALYHKQNFRTGSTYYAFDWTPPNPNVPKLYFSYISGHATSKFAIAHFDFHDTSKQWKAHWWARYPNEFFWRESKQITIASGSSFGVLYFDVGQTDYIIYMCYRDETTLEYGRGAYYYLGW